MEQTGYSVVSACVITLRRKDKVTNQVSQKYITSQSEGTICLVAIAFCGFIAGLCYRFNASIMLMIFAIIIAVLGAAALQFRQVSDI